MSLNVLETDEHGNIVAKLVIGWSVTTVQDVTVLAAFEYADSPSELKTEGRKIQFELTPAQSLRLAASLTEVVKHILTESSEKPNVNNAQLDQLLEAESVLRHELMQGLAERRFHVAEGQDAPPARSAWSGVSKGGLRAGGHSFHQIGDGALLVQTLYWLDWHDIEITERISLAADHTRLRCQLMLTSGGVTSLHDDEFPLNREA